MINLKQPNPVEEACLVVDFVDTRRGEVLSMKECRKCGKVRPLEDFNRNKPSKGGRLKICRACSRKQAEKYKGRYKVKRKTPEGRFTRNIYRKSYREKNPERGKMRICVTGMGSIGTAVINELIGTDAEICALDSVQHKKHYYNGLYGKRVICHTVDICNLDRLCDIFSGCDMVFHTVAAKYVPESQEDVKEVFRVNTIGTLVALTAADIAGVEKFFFMSTDKAVNPISKMGLSKKVAESIVLEGGSSIIRSGNCSGSEGCFFDSIPKLLAQGKRIPITSLTASRYIIDIDDLAKKIVRCFDDLKPGQIYIPEMDHRNVYSYLSDRFGYFKYDEVGLRPGEKNDEELKNSDEEVVEDIEGWGKILRKKAK